MLCIVVSATACTNVASSTPVVLPDSSADADFQLQTQARTEEAIAILARMSEFLGSRSSFRFIAEIRYDAVQPSGQKIEFGSQRKYAVRRPDHARVEVSHWDGGQELLGFDGRRLSLLLPWRRVYASAPYTGSVAEAFDYLIAEYGLASPLADLLRRELPDEVAQRVLSARRVAVVEIGGVLCDQLAFRGEKVNFQIFVRQGDEPLPMRFLIDYHAEVGSPQFRARLRDWDLEPELPESLFQIVPPAGAQSVPFDELMDLLLGPLSDKDGAS
jgi:hypothetical protein